MIFRIRTINEYSPAYTPWHKMGNQTIQTHVECAFTCPRCTDEQRNFSALNRQINVK